MGWGEIPIEAEEQLLERSKLSEHPDPPSLRAGLRQSALKAIQLWERRGRQQS